MRRCYRIQYEYNMEVVVLYEYWEINKSTFSQRLSYSIILNSKRKIIGTINFILQMHNFQKKKKIIGYFCNLLLFVIYSLYEQYFIFK